MIFMARVTIQTPLIASEPYNTFATIEAASIQEAKEKFNKYLTETYGKCREVYVDIKSILVYPFIQ